VESFQCCTAEANKSSCRLVVRDWTDEAHDREVSKATKYDLNAESSDAYIADSMVEAQLWEPKRVERGAMWLTGCGAV
jgi:hypothetical protein